MNGAGGINQKRRPIIIKELETRYEKNTAIYNGTMERLRRLNGGRHVTDKAAIVMLSQEIEAYRARVEDMKAEIQSLRTMSTKILTEDIVRTDIFSKNVKRLLDEKCMSQRELADAVGVTEVAMSRYLKDGRMPKGPILYNMAKALGVSVDDLLAGPEEKDCTSCEYGPVWNDVCRTCRGTGQTNADPEETVAGSGPQAEKEAGNILDQLIRKGDALKIFNGIISVPRKTPDESVKAFQEHLQKYADRIKALPAEGTAEPKLKPCPFCGSEAHITKVRARFFKGRAKVNKYKKYYAIGCSDPDCILYSTERYARLFVTASEDGIGTMVRRWNRRHDE
jgi:transcriptional regulator with XRE-family HTH domain